MNRFGLSVAIATPFDTKGDIDLPRLVAHAQWCITKGCDSVTLFGTTGEGATVGARERARAFEAMINAGLKPRTQLLSSVATSSVEDAVDQAAMALDLGFRGLLLTPPFYFRAVDDEGIYRWFAQVFERLGPKARDMFAYHIPSMTGISLSPALIGRLKKDFPGIVVGVKDSSSNWSNTEQLLKQHSDLMILVGDERDLGRAVRGGGSGSICGVANIFPDILGPVAREGKEDARVRPIVDAICRQPVLPAIKALVAGTKSDREWARMRPPLADLDAASAAKLLAEVSAAAKAAA